MDLVAPFPRLNLYDPRWKIYTNPADLPSPIFLGSGSARSALVSEGSVVKGNLLRSVVGLQTFIDDDAEVVESVIGPRRVITGESVCIEEGVVIGEGEDLPNEVAPQIKRQSFESMAAGHSSTGNENSGTQLINFSSDDRWFMDGDIFFAFTGAHFDARTLIPELKNKAKLIITEKEATGSNVIYRPDARQIYKKFIKAGAKVYPLHVLGITGTKGKSTIAWWLSSLLGFGYMGTLGIRAKDVKFVLPTTTTGADALFNTYRRTGEDHWVVELSSIGLAEDRLPLPLEGLVWTTFEPEHTSWLRKKPFLT